MGGKLSLFKKIQHPKTKPVTLDFTSGMDVRDQSSILSLYM